MNTVGSSIWIDLMIVLFLIVLNGIFAMTEIALISSKPSKLEVEANRGKRSAQIALKYSKDPTDLLSTVQVGITLIGIINGAYGGARFSTPVGNVFEQLGMSAQSASTVGYVLVVTVITYLSLIIGELVPKRIALVAPERVTMAIIPALDLFSKVMRPFIWILSKSTLFLFKLLGLKAERTDGETELEIKQLLFEGAQQGQFAHEEVQQVERVFAFHDQLIYELMQPRTTLEWVDLEDSMEDIEAAVYESKHSKLPVGRGTLDEFVGYVDVRDVLMLPELSTPSDILKKIKQPLIVPKQREASQVLQMMQQTGSPIAFVLDEYGGFLGLVTLFDILEEIVGEVMIEEEPPDVVRREDGTYLADGLLSIEDLKRTLGIRDARFDEGRNAYHTLAGLVIYTLGDFPKRGDVVEAYGLRFEVVDMDGKRVDQVLISVLPEETKEA
ncbi:hemolysin family protein [Exiguobacterium sp. ZOR0005]|uniref:hemolysin family protein n=1 Tax=Exiguobacterium sp. ZOR0005 TaxID=1339226 RepID=UPI0004A3DEE4|nr:hemolysin family protein [Exiguobacterium sp. ZOR0005]